MNFKLPAIASSIDQFGIVLANTLPSDVAENGIALLCDENTLHHCTPLVQGVLSDKLGLQAKVITMPAGEQTKTLSTLEQVWLQMVNHGLTRKSVLINLGGGVVTDLGGFAAATYMRGIPFIQVPTSLLAMVDAAQGAKTGIDFLGHKNMIGSFADPLAVLIYPEFLSSLPKRELYAGLAEMLKHCMVANPFGFYSFRNILTPAINKQTGQALTAELLQLWTEWIVANNEIKGKIVQADPREAHVRKLLNWGHSVGHAIEACALEGKLPPILHGEAVMLGILIESVYSSFYYPQPNDWLPDLADYGDVILSENSVDPTSPPVIGWFKLLDFDLIWEHMAFDKKNNAGQRKGVLMKGISDMAHDHVYDKEIMQKVFQRIRGFLDKQH